MLGESCRSGVQTGLPDLAGGFAVIAIPAHKVWESLKVSPGPLFYFFRICLAGILVSTPSTLNKDSFAVLFSE